MRTIHKGGLAAADINSRRTGVAFGEEDSPAPRCLSWQLDGCATDDALIRSGVKLYDSVYELCAVMHPRFFVIEAPLNIPGRNPSTGKALLALAYIAATAATKGGAFVIFGNVSTVRVHFIGKGNLPGDEAKAAVMERCRILRWKVENHDEGDSAALWCWGMSKNFRHWAPNGTPLFAGNDAA